MQNSLSLIIGPSTWWNPTINCHASSNSSKWQSWPYPFFDAMLQLFIGPFKETEFFLCPCVGCWLCWMRLMLLSLVTRNGFRIHITFNSVLIKSFYGGYKVELFSPKVQINILSLLMTPKVWLILYCAIVEEWSVKRAANEKRVQLITLHLMSGADVKRRVEAGVWW